MLRLTAKVILLVVLLATLRVSSVSTSDGNHSCHIAKGGQCINTGGCVFCSPTLTSSCTCVIK
jgi:hypothetical protein